MGGISHLRPGLTLVRITQNRGTIFVSYLLVMTMQQRAQFLHEIQTAESCQIKEKCGRNEIITVVKIILTNQIVLIVDWDFSSVMAFVVYTQ